MFLVVAVRLVAVRRRAPEVRAESSCETGRGMSGKEWDQVPVYSFRLFIAGRTARSLAAESNLRLLCDTRLGGDYHLEVVDLADRPDLAVNEHIIATPTVIRLAPAPQVRVIGDLSELNRAAAHLGFPDPPAAWER